MSAPARRMIRGACEAVTYLGAPGGYLEHMQSQPCPEISATRQCTFDSRSGSAFVYHLMMPEFGQSILIQGQYSHRVCAPRTRITWQAYRVIRNLGRHNQPKQQSLSVMCVKMESDLYEDQ